jgi:hypothetical protein
MPYGVLLYVIITRLQGLVNGNKYNIKTLVIIILKAPGQESCLRSGNAKKLFDVAVLRIIHFSTYSLLSCQ